MKIFQMVLLVLFSISCTYCFHKKENADNHKSASEPVIDYNVPDSISITVADPEAFFELPDTISLSFVERVDSLQSLFRRIKEVKDLNLKKKYHTLFFYFFPDNFDDFNEIFGYKEIDQFRSEQGPLYYESDKYFITFLHELEIDKKLIFLKIIDITNDGHWDADAVGSFQSMIQNVIRDNLNLFLILLSERDAREISDFWYFYFDGPHPSNLKGRYELLYPQVKAINANIARLMSQAFEKLLSEEDHGH
jgi:hypothetical protein